MTLLNKLLIMLSLLTVIYMNDGSYTYVVDYYQWTKDSSVYVGHTRNIVQIPIGIKYTLDGQVHLVPYSSIKEIVEE